MINDICRTGWRPDEAADSCEDPHVNPNNRIIADHFLKAARHHASEAFLTFLTEDPPPMAYTVAAHHAGSCVELLSKSLLAEIDMTLIIETTHEATMLSYLSSGRFNILNWLRSARTISASSALKMIQEVHRVPNEDRFGSFILDARNAAVHAGLAPANPILLADELADFLRFFLPSKYQLTEEDSTIDDSQTFLPQPANKIVADRFNVRIGAVRKKINSAKRKSDSLLKTLSSSGKSDDEIITILTDKEMVSWASHLSHCDDQNQQECPACGHQAVAGLTILDVYEEFEGPGEWSQVVDFEHSLACGVCMLALTDNELSVLSLSEEPVRYP